MGGFGSGRAPRKYPGNWRSEAKEFFEMYPGEGYQVTKRDGTKEVIYSLKGKKYKKHHRTRNKSKLAFKRHQQDLEATLDDIEKIKLRDEQRKTSQLPHNVEALKKHRAYLAKRRYLFKVVRERIILIRKIKGICPLCDTFHEYEFPPEDKEFDGKYTTKWIITEFARKEQGAICRGCYSYLLQNTFENDSAKLKLYLKLCDYNQLRAMK